MTLLRSFIRPGLYAYSYPNLKTCFVVYILTIHTI